MRVIETTAHVGSDGMLRLEVPVEERERDVRVTVVMESPQPGLPNQASPVDRWASCRTKLESAGIRVPPPGVDNSGPVKAVVLPAPSASQVLISDRR